MPSRAFGKRQDWMNSDLLFAQFLLNHGVLKVTEIREFLPKTLATKVDLPLQALFRGAATAVELDSLGALSGEAFRKSAEEEGVLTASQIHNLGEAIAGEGCLLAQALLDAGRLNYKEVEQLFHDYGRMGEHPLQEAMEKAAVPMLLEELPLYTEYVGVAFHALKRFMGIACVINPTGTPLADGDLPGYIVSQAITGAVSFVTGLAASDEVFLELARRYSHEDFRELDELAVDSLAEFLNVLNGFFAVRLGERDLELDLNLPKTATELHLSVNKLLNLHIESPVGPFNLLIAADEFI